MSDVQIKISRNGPYLVTGDVTLVDGSGVPRDVEKSTVALCRCGHSSDKPFCDGTHSAVGFAPDDA